MIHLTGPEDEITVICCGLRYSELPRGDAHTSDVCSVNCSLVRLVGEAIEDACLTHRGHDLGTIHRDTIALAAIAAVRGYRK